MGFPERNTLVIPLRKFQGDEKFDVIPWLYAKIVKKRVSLGFNSENLYRSMKIYFEREMRLTDTIRDFTVLIRYTEIY